MDKCRDIGINPDNLQAMGMDSTPVNTGHLQGCAKWIESILNRKLVYLVCCLHLVELPLRKVSKIFSNFSKLDFQQLLYYILLRGHLNWKKPKKFGFWPKFSGPLPPLLEKGPYRRKRRYFVPNSNCKVRFFSNFRTPPPILEKTELHRFC